MTRTFRSAEISQTMTEEDGRSKCDVEAMFCFGRQRIVNTAEV